MEYSDYNNTDLNELFNFSYNFDLLKGIIEKLLKNQQTIQKQLDAMKEDNKELKILKNELNTTKEQMKEINEILQIDGNNETNNARDKDMNKYIDKDKNKYTDNQNILDSKKPGLGLGKNIEQMKNNILELMKELEKTKKDLNLHKENMNILSNKYEKEINKTGEDKSIINDRIRNLEKKINLLLGDISPKELENEDELRKKRAAEENKKKAEIIQINKKLAQLDSNKIDTAIFDMKTDKFLTQLDEFKNKLNELIFSIYGYTGDQYEIPKNIKFAKEDEYIKHKLNMEYELGRLWAEIKKLKEMIDAIKENIKGNCKLKDIETNNNYILQKMDELLEGLNKKFVLKSDNSNAFKNLEDQFRRIILLLATKIEHENNNWLLAKKPISGYSCAACESYIGDLKEEKDDKYLTWKKLPLREREKESEQEKLYRLGNGYSHILKMVGVDPSGNVSLNPNSNKDLKMLFPGNNEMNKTKEGFDIKIKKNIIFPSSESAKKTYHVIKTKNKEGKLPMIKGNTLSMDDFDKIIENPNNTLSPNDIKISPTITRILKKSNSKLNL